MSKLFNPKLFSLLKAGIDKKQISNDVMAGIVVGIVALPLAIAFAVASGVSPDKGLITAIVAGLLISFLGGSRVQIGGPTGAFIVIVYGIVETHGVGGLIISTIMAGVLLVIFGCLKLGTLLKYFPHPLIVGFTSGIALVIFSTQIKDAFGLDIDKVPSDFLAKWELYFTQIHTLNTTALILTVATILISVYSKKITSKIPGSFIAIIAITVAVQLFDLPVTTIESFFGEIPTTISISFPAIEWANLSQYIAPAITIALLGAIESLLSAVVADGMIGGNHRSNTELIAQGIANIVTPFFGGIPATGAIARTATNIKNGGRSPIAGIVHALTLLLIMLFFGKWAKLIPMSCLAGVLIVVSYNMSEWRVFRSILKSSGFDILVLLTTFFLTVLVDLTIAIEVGVVLSAVLFMKRMADKGEQIQKDVNVDLIEDYSDLPKDISVYEISGPFFFASAKQYAQLIQQIGLKSKTIVIRMRHVPFIDATGFHNFKAVINSLQNSNVKIILSGVNESVLMDMEKYNLISKIGEDHIFDSFNHALDYARATYN
ncbi:STAS domain-containing protein [Ancylomarina euxinus]|uniref:STAS domain-containing protein n=1 Tax=Ancylomarina euxinus TaxID=2283627 RepID=A0A425Y8G3_9BACT|nr:SulP family inorganic anion transporter [Ancylomarina euxinus]MCZ4693490.1 SulP family inorganic anion transporter [Ancylomarina euxinus]MUP13717.1 STAS domain-containing protein [Ancylomarina euxinus]RRG24865.1 STAS domain-containing protein [Ancylomarina euxinus]